MTYLDKIIADLTKGAAEAGASVETWSVGQEMKLANISLLSGLSGAANPAVPKMRAMLQEGPMVSGGMKMAHADRAYQEGVQSVLNRYKMAFLGTVANIAAGPLMRAALPSVGKRLGTGAVGQIADAAVGHVAGNAMDRLSGGR